MRFDHIVVGAGSMGSAAAYFLGKARQKVLLVDAYEPPHIEGSHHGDTRLIRFAYGEGEKYVPFVLRAKQLWDDIANESGKHNFLQTGIINVGDINDDFIQSVQRAAKAFDLPFEHLSADEIMKKWPGIQVPQNFIALLETTSGVLLTKPAIEGYLQEAAKYDVTFEFKNAVETIVMKENYGTIILKNGNTYEAKNIIVTVGAWANELLKQTGINIPVLPLRKTFAWFEANEQLYGDALFPGFTFQFGEESYYGFPSIDGAGLKVGRHDGGKVINPSEKKAPFGEVESEREDLERFLQEYMPQVGELKEGKTCMYAMTPDADFIIDRHPQYSNLIIAAGFSGHGFKFASAVGEALSELALGKETTIQLQPFSMNRFIQ